MARIAPAWIVLGLVPWLSGCVAAAAAGVAGVGFVQYQRNEIERDYATDFEVTWQATLEALGRLGYPEPSVTREATEGRLDLEGLALRVDRHPEGFTRVRVRVGTFHTRDHERRAELVLEEIARTLEDGDELQDWSKKIADGEGSPPQ